MQRTMNRMFVAATFVLTALSAPCARAQGAAPGDAWLCYKAQPLSPRATFVRFPGRTGDVVVDAFATALPADRRQVDLSKVQTVCAPAALVPASPGDATTHLEAYKAKLTRTEPAQPRVAVQVHEVRNGLGTLKLEVRGLAAVKVPSAVASGTAGTSPLGTTAVDPFKCYDVRVAKAPRGALPFPTFQGAQVAIADARGTRILDLKRPKRLCNPANINGAEPDAPSGLGHLVCYPAKLARTTPKQTAPSKTEVSVQNRFGAEFLGLGAITDVCLPSWMDPPSPTSTPTPIATPTAVGTPGDVTAIRVGPARRVVDPAGQASFSATEDLTDGTSKNVTQKVTWSSSDPSIASVSNVDGERGRVTGHKPGVVTIVALDPIAGLSSTAFQADGTFTVRGVLESITVSPAKTSRGVGDVLTYGATAHYGGGGTENITQRMSWATSNAAIAKAPNEEGNRSKVLTLVPGTVTVSAVDSVSGMSASTAELRVLGALERITLAPAAATRIVSTTQNYTATGHFAGGEEENITQRMVYSSSNLGVAFPPNEDGNRSKVLLVGLGQATISATDTVTGLSTTSTGDDATITVTGPLEKITLSPATTTRAVGQPLNVTATATYGGGATKNVTQQLVYTSSKPSVAEVPNEDGNKSRVVLVSPGTATISAVDPVSGIGSAASGGNTTLVVTGPLESLTITPATATRKVGEPQGYTVIGHYVGGATKNLTQVVEYTSSNPEVAQAPNVDGNRGQILAIGVGTATISARDAATGITTTSGADAIVTVTP